MVAILGDFAMEKSEEISSRRKLILFRMQSMIHHELTAEESTFLYTNLLAISGRGGYEMTRTSGTAGLVNEQTHKDFCYVLSQNPGLLPTRGSACYVVPNGRKYTCLYKKHKMKSEKNSHPIAITHYPPPKLGGSFAMSPKIFEIVPFMAEFTYQKMLAILVLKRANEIWESENQPPVAVGPIECEMEDILLAREAYHITGTYHSLLTNFIICKSSSLVPYAVGVHDDYFNNDESAENKTTMEVPLGQSGIGRGGSWVNNSFVVAILDWGWGGRLPRTFLLANAPAMGIVPTPRFAQRQLNHFYDTAPNGHHWQQVQARYNRGANRARQQRQRQQQQNEYA